MNSPDATLSCRRAFVRAPCAAKAHRPDNLISSIGRCNCSVYNCRIKPPAELLTIMLEKTVKPIDKLIGANIRANRLTRAVTQHELADRIGLTFQQVQKYENGKNRVGGSRHIQIAEALNVPVVALFKGAEIGPRPIHSELSDLIVNRRAIRLLRAFTKIKQTSSQQALLKLAEDIAGER